MCVIWHEDAQQTTLRITSHGAMQDHVRFCRFTIALARQAYESGAANALSAQ